MKNTLITTALCLALSLSLAPAQAASPDTQPNWAKEHRWEQQIVPQIVIGEDIHLKANGKEFLGLYTESSQDYTRGAVILVHGGGIHPDWPLVIKPLRISLPDQGWATLSIQMPVLVNDAREEDYVPLFKEHSPARIKAAVDFLKAKNIDNIFLVGHSLGAAMASDYLARSRDMRVKAFIGIGMSGMPSAKYPQLDNTFSLVQVRQPVLDIYGSQSNKNVLGSVDRRVFAIKARNIEPSRQVKIIGSDHYFEAFEEQLQREIVSYMTNITGQNQSVKANSK